MSETDGVVLETRVMQRIHREVSKLPGEAKLRVAQWLGEVVRSEVFPPTSPDLLLDGTSASSQDIFQLQHTGVPDGE